MAYKYNEIIVFRQYLPYIRVANELLWICPYDTTKQK